jgi:hypothetical protein
MYILIGLPLITLAANTALFIHLSGRVDLTNLRIDTMRQGIESRLELIIGKLADIDTRVSVLEAREQR